MIESKMSRDKVARWLIEKLLASFVISTIIIYGPIIGFNIQKSGLGTTYTVVTSVTLLISLIANVLIPQDFGISRRIEALKGKKQESEAEIE
jgi:hypothetical protein